MLFGERGTQKCGMVGHLLRKIRDGKKDCWKRECQWTNMSDLGGGHRIVGVDMMG